MDFVAIDFETANSNMTSACSLGIAVVSNNKVIEVKEWLIKPTPFYFEYYNSKVHGITEDDVKDCSSFNEIWNEICSYLKESILVAHNASFDMSVLKHLIQYFNLDDPCFDYFCSCQMSKNIWTNLENHKLSTVCKHLNIDLQHHNAASDASGCAEIVIAALEIAYIFNMDFNSFIFLESLNQLDFSNSPLKPLTASTAKFKNKIDYSKLSPSVCSFDDCHPLYNKNIVFTGDLSSLQRREAIQKVLDLGATVKSGVSKNTNYLVVGIQDKDIVGSNGLSTKQVKAYSLIEQGIDIKIIPEDEFLKLIS